MKKLFLHISVCCLTLLCMSFSTVNESANNSISPLSVDAKRSVSIKASLLYGLMDLERKGLSKQAFEYAYKGYEALTAKNIVARTGYLTICDLSQSARRKRLYVIDLINNELVLNTYVAHGKNSGDEYARRFSNKAESFQSSLGFYLTGNTYIGENGLSLRLQGLEPGFNDRAFKRAIVVHGASYIGDGSTGRSFGCPAVPIRDSRTLINTIKKGTCLFIYHPQKNYLIKSKILNG